MRGDPPDPRTLSCVSFRNSANRDHRGLWDLVNVDLAGHGHSASKASTVQNRKFSTACIYASILNYIGSAMHRALPTSIVADRMAGCTGVVGGLRPEASGLRLEAGGWRLEAGGWRLAADTKWINEGRRDFPCPHEEAPGAMNTEGPGRSCPTQPTGIGKRNRAARR